MYKHPAELQFTALFVFHSHSQHFIFILFALSPVGVFGPAEQLRDSSIGVGLPVDLPLPRLLLQRWGRVFVGFMGFYWLIVRHIMPVVTFSILWALGALISVSVIRYCRPYVLSSHRHLFMVSSSSKKKASVKHPAGWHRPFMSFLEPRQHLWDTLEDDPAKLAFLEDSRMALEEWALAEAPHATLPEHCVLKSYLAGYHTSFSKETGWLYEDYNHSKPKFLYAGAALNNVEKNLSNCELLSVATMKERWDTGLGITPHQKRING
ncbi:hypothetical protein FIBSPDRAFT_886887 [Athelia psychrophila]|uniref:Uncharacterized protein n=1 Tax=Athelia psychrophila TaxID=1759441 RepID=A0A166QCB3_9AGAM|nr:hypothetical protein FIBSPDRAFT_886887 [Fibularhizoctonia sp. CBS 109695]